MKMVSCQLFLRLEFTTSVRLFDETEHGLSEYLDFLLRDEVFRQQHLCSNLLTPSEAPETNEGRGFCDNYDKERIPQVPGYNFPHQV